MTTTTQTAPRHCAHCGSTLGLDCGEAEPDHDRDHCSIGCYALATVAITFQGPGYYYLESADGMASLDLDKIATEEGLRAAVVECIDVGTGAESWAGWKTTLASISLGSDGAAYAKALATAATPSTTSTDAARAALVSRYRADGDAEQWRSSRETCEYVAAALEYDDGAWQQGEADTIWQEAARYAIADGCDDTDLLCWGYESRTIAAVIAAWNRAPIATLPADFVAACRCNEGAETLEDWICEAVNASAAAVADDGAVSVQSAGQWSTLADVRQIMATINGTTTTTQER